MKFDYEALTKDAYKNSDVATTYHDAFTGRLRWASLRARYIAHREQVVIGTLLDTVNPHKVIDIPAGTGKLAWVLAGRQCDVLAADVSSDMLEIAKTTYSQLVGGRATYRVCDAEQVGSLLANFGADVLVCLRLMHRVPPDVRFRMLKSFSEAARYAVISFGIKSPYHAARKRLRNLVFRQPPQPLCLETLDNIRQELSKHFHVIRESWISRVLSEEIVVLARSKSFTANK